MGGCRRNTQQCISFWQPVAPPGYLPLGHVPSIGLDPPADPVLVYRNDSEKGSRPSVKPAREFHLIWRQNGRSPVTMWEPLPPEGYRAVGTVLVLDAEQPGSNDVLCVREDLCVKTGIFDSPIWKFEPPIMQVELLGPRCHILWSPGVGLADITCVQVTALVLQFADTSPCAMQLLQLISILTLFSQSATAQGSHL